jgi:hypothetical protein
MAYSTDLSQTLEAGTMLIIETGEYSDRGWSGPVLLVKTYTKEQLADDYRNEWRKVDDEDGYDEPTPDGFMPWLIRTGRAVDVAGVQSWHVGCYSKFEP